MAQVTVQQLAEVVGASVDRLLTQMKDSGLPHAEAEQVVSDEDKQTLLAYLTVITVRLSTGIGLLQLTILIAWGHCF